MKKRKRALKSGLPPGTLLFTGDRKMDKVQMEIIRYGVEVYESMQLDGIKALLDHLEHSQEVTWVNIEGIHDEAIIEQICTHLGMHKLSMEDILSVGQRPKLDDYPDYLLLTCKMFQWNKEENSLDEEQLSFVLKGSVLITFQEKTGDVFESVRRRIREGKGNIRKRKADYLLYALLDSVVDHYFVMLEIFGEKLESLETSLLEQPQNEQLQRIHALRRETLSLRRSVYPLREVINKLERLEESYVSPDTRIFIRDLYDHTIQVIETIEVFRDMASGLLDLYMNSLSHKMNEIMKVLTIIATVFIPLTFVVGVYGMNFVNMPELEYEYAYFIVWACMIVIVMGMMYYFRKKRWM